jgi:hypothetical protein
MMYEVQCKSLLCYTVTNPVKSERTDFALFSLILLIILLRLQYLDYTALNDRMIDEWWIGKGLEGSGRGLIEVLSQHCFGGARENYVKLC